MTFGENEVATLDAARDREMFRQRIAESRRLIKAGDADGANAATAELEPIAERWRAVGRLFEYLSPLLGADEAPYVRFNAATYLLTHGHEEAALSALEDLKTASVGAASRDAGLILGDWRQRQS